MYEHSIGHSTQLRDRLFFFLAPLLFLALLGILEHHHSNTNTFLVFGPGFGWKLIDRPSTLHTPRYSSRISQSTFLPVRGCFIHPVTPSGLSLIGPRSGIVCSSPFLTRTSFYHIPHRYSFAWTLNLRLVPPFRLAIHNLTPVPTFLDLEYPPLPASHTLVCSIVPPPLPYSPFSSPGYKMSMRSLFSIFCTGYVYSSTPLEVILC